MSNLPCSDSRPFPALSLRPLNPQRAGGLEIGSRARPADATSDQRSRTPGPSPNTYQDRPASRSRPLTEPAPQRSARVHFYDAVDLRDAANILPPTDLERREGQCSVDLEWVSTETWNV